MTVCDNAGDVLQSWALGSFAEQAMNLNYLGVSGSSFEFGYLVFQGGKCGITQQSHPGTVTAEAREFTVGFRASTMLAFGANQTLAAGVSNNLIWSLGGSHINGTPWAPELPEEKPG